jgi:hypothetical protein
MYLRNVVLAALVPAMAAFAQNPITADSPVQVGYAANLNIGESYIDITNTGANGAPLLGPGFGAASGNICVNVYSFDPGEELISCCSCLVTPDQTVNLGVNRDLTVKTLTGVVPTSVTVKLLATLAGTNGTGTSCTNSAATVATPLLPPACVLGLPTLILLLSLVLRPSAYKGGAHGLVLLRALAWVCVIVPPEFSPKLQPFRSLCR